MTPPLRDAHHQRQLWRGLRTDDLQVVSTDHCPFCFNEQPYGIKYSKQQGRADFSKIPNGAPGIETRLPLIHDGRASDAAVVLFDPARPGTSARLSITAGSTTAFSKAGRLQGGSRRCSCAGSLSSTASDGSVARAGAISSDAAVLARLDDQRVIRWAGHCVCSQARLPRPVRRGGQTLRAIARSCRARAL